MVAEVGSHWPGAREQRRSPARWYPTSLPELALLMAAAVAEGSSEGLLKSPAALGFGERRARAKFRRRRRREAQAFLLGACRGVAPSPSRGEDRLPASCSRPARSDSVQYRSHPGDVRAMCGRHHGPHSCSERGGGGLCRLDQGCLLGERPSSGPERLAFAAPP